MKYNDISDEELLYHISDGDEVAYDILFERYKKTISQIALNFSSYIKGTCLEINDLIQEGMVGLNNAIKNYGNEKSASFKTFMNICVKRSMMTLIKLQKRHKHKYLNESISFESDDDDKYKFESVLKDNTFNPEERIIFDEKQRLLIDNVSKKLTNFEKEVFDLKQAGLNYKEIGDILDKPYKSIDNALTRIKAKLKEELYNLNR